jgi:hypothetical protein
VAAQGVQGIAAARAALEWGPIQAMATECPVIVIYIASSKQSAAFLSDWDSWRRAGSAVFPLYVSDAPAVDVVRAQGSEETRGSMDEGEMGSLLPEHDRCWPHLTLLLLSLKWSSI